MRGIILFLVSESVLRVLYMTLIIIIMIRILDIIGVNVFCECGRALILLFFVGYLCFMIKMD